MGNLSSSDSDSDLEGNSNEAILHVRHKSSDRTPLVSDKSECQGPSTVLVFPTSQSTEFTMTKREVTSLQHMFTAQVRHKGNMYPGATIFQGIFAQAPKARQVFVDYAVDRGHGTTYERHYIAFSKALNYVIKNLHEPILISEYLKSLGAKHNCFTTHGFDPVFWNAFGDCMIKCAFDWGKRQDRTKQKRQAWSKVVLFMIGRMREGYYKERRQNRLLYPDHNSATSLNISPSLQCVGKSQFDDSPSTSEVNFTDTASSTLPIGKWSRQRSLSVNR